MTKYIFIEGPPHTESHDGSWGVNKIDMASSRGEGKGSNSLKLLMVAISQNDEGAIIIGVRMRKLLVSLLIGQMIDGEQRKKLFKSLLSVKKNYMEFAID